MNINNIIYIDNLHMRLIPEWNNHTNCLIAWPCNQDLYGNQLHQARIEIANHDVDSSHVYSSLPIGNYHRYIYQGNYSFTFSKSGYHSKTINASILNNNTTYLNVQLVPINFVNIEEIDLSEKITKSIDLLGRKSQNQLNKIKIDVHENGSKTKKIIIKNK